VLTELLVKSVAGRRVALRTGRQRTTDIVHDVSPYLSRGDRIVDIGAGTCTVTAALSSEGFDLVAVDVRNLSCVDTIAPVLFDGKRLPFADDFFDVALLINILHHVRDPDQSLREAKRVARRLIIHEDIYSSPAQRRLTMWMDSLTNLEFTGHPHSNRDDLGWRATFAALDLNLRTAKYKTFWTLFSNATYVVER
jgi:SAM-dependent methyltransferase